MNVRFGCSVSSLSPVDNRYREDNGLSVHIIEGHLCAKRAYAKFAGAIVCREHFPAMVALCGNASYELVPPAEITIEEDTWMS